MEENRITDAAHATDEELNYESSLRPSLLSEYIGQPSLKENLSVFIEAARRRGGALDHALFYGPPGLGKTTIAHIIANELSAQIKVTSGPALQRAGDLAAILTNLSEFDVLFIDEIHRLAPAVEEILYPAMEDYQIDIIIGQGPAARSVNLSLPPFTLVGATTRAGLLTSPLRDRFGIIHRLDFYDTNDLDTIVKRSAAILNLEVTPEGSIEIARRSRGTPRIANRLLRRVRDFAEVKADGVVTEEVARDSLQRLEVDECGLDKMDKRLLKIIIDIYSGGPVGVDSMAASIGEDRDTIEDVIEPYLLQEGFLKRTSRGRMVTSKAFQHLGLEIPPSKESQPKLL